MKPNTNPNPDPNPNTPRKDLKEEVEKMIQSVGLTEKRKAYSKTLSGGQKR
jgi:ABC-type methionine transport system ATPase subunit